ncbi:MAG: indolepyruvate ferredoxin oxidoreductase subunit alpha [Anaerofustis stercorihominis]|nr:indolepyruvate ferredoxin oxidoreductase subunit alpha [Anaerofustis stercorihominis]
MKSLLTGNEAIAMGAIDAGAKYAGAYPGTPSTEILENLAEHKDEIYSEWAPNEKVALEGAIGAAYAGVRSLAAMKHVGLNVAADPFFTNAYVGVNAGLIVVSADDPGMHSSQNEQDNRHYAYHANVPMFEPSNSQDCYDMVREAYEISEKYDTPVLIRLTTRVSHSKSIVERKEVLSHEFRPFEKDPMKYVTVPAVAKGLKLKVIKRREELLAYSEVSPFNTVEYNDKSIGIIASGICYEYAKEVLGDKASYLKLGFTYPLPTEKIKEFASNVDKIYVIEENDPIMEKEVKALGIEVIGKDAFPLNGEMLPQIVRKVVLGEANEVTQIKKDDMPPRPPALCSGCPHRGIFYSLARSKARREKIYISGDIGCYSLGYADPYNALDSIICMGASISAAHGASKVYEMMGLNDNKAVAVIGDSTFFHTGINSLMNVAYNKSKVITIILDNRITGMTGHQQNPGTGYTAQGAESDAIDIPLLVKAIGIENIRTINPNDLTQVEDALSWAMELDGPSVIIARYPCALKRFSQADKAEFGDMYIDRYIVDTEKCNGCKSCMKSGCPALSFDKENKKANINEDSCLGCGICAQICKQEAIQKAR